MGRALRAWRGIGGDGSLASLGMTDGRTATSTTLSAGVRPYTLRPYTARPYTLHRNGFEVAVEEGGSFAAGADDAHVNEIGRAHV